MLTATSTSDSMPVPTSPGFWSGALLAAGALGLLLTSALYGITPVAVALPVPDMNLPDALRAAREGGFTLHLAGTAGVLSDFILCVAALLTGLRALTLGRERSGAGWLLVALSGATFIVVDASAAFVLAPLSAMPDATAAFAGFKLLFDGLFDFGTVAFGAGTVLAFFAAPDAASLGIGVRTRVAALVVGTLAIIAAVGCIAGINLALPLGLTIALASIVYFLIGVRFVRFGHA